ncbi:MAG: sulfatase [Planctomycetes bacterium]|nr:sulfatase [Planctomycetota bacterium]
MFGRGGKRPNLVFVFPDQMRGQAMGFLGEEPVITPCLDAFAGESLVLPQGVSNYPVCSPYRGMLMSGKFPHKNGVLANCNTNGAQHGYELKEDERCWSDILKDQGYSLGYIGKWHLDSPYKPHVDTSNNSENFAWNEWCPPERRHGFDFWCAYGTYDRHMRPMYWRTNDTREGFSYVDQWGPEFEADTAIKYITNEGGEYREDGKPFALVVSMNPPHTGYSMFPKRYLQHYEHLTTDELCIRPNIPPADTNMGRNYRRDIRNYFAMITGVDEQFGRILEALKEQGLEEDTIVVFTSDHGNCLGIHNKITKNNHYEESMRVPFIIRWPGKIKPRKDDLLFSGLDIYSTLLDMMGLAGEIPADVDSVSRAGIFLNNRGERPRSQWYMHVPYGEPQYDRRGVRTHTHTLMVQKSKDEPTEIVLHDNVNDPYQLENAAEENPEVVKTLIAELETWLKKYDDPWLTG